MGEGNWRERTGEKQDDASSGPGVGREKNTTGHGMIGFQLLIFFQWCFSNHGDIVGADLGVAWWRCGPKLGGVFLLLDR